MCNLNKLANVMEEKIRILLIIEEVTENHLILDPSPFKSTEITQLKYVRFRSDVLNCPKKASKITMFSIVVFFISIHVTVPGSVEQAVCVRY